MRILSKSPILFTNALIFTSIIIGIHACKHEPVLPVDTGMPTDTTGTDTTGNPGSLKPCDPDSVYFETDVLPILLSNCAISTCHDAVTHQDGVELTSFEKVISTADVKAFDLNGSDLYEVITETDQDKKMPPPPRAALSQDQVNIIGAWIQQGAQDLSCDANCDSTNVTYSGTIQPLLQDHCTGCHGGNTPSGGIDLTAHAGVAVQANNGKLLGAVSHQAGYSKMPQGGDKLPDCQIEQIRIWIDSGAQNN